MHALACPELSYCLFEPQLLESHVSGGLYAFLGTDEHNTSFFFSFFVAAVCPRNPVSLSIDSRIFKCSQTTLFINAHNTVEFAFLFIIHLTLSYFLDEGTFLWTTRHVQKTRFQKTVQRAVRSVCQQNTVGRARGIVPMFYYSRKDCNNNNMDSVNDFHIHTEVSSVESGKHLHSARQVSSREGRGAAWDCVWNIALPLLFYGWLKELDGFPHRAAPSMWGNIDQSLLGCFKMKDRMRTSGPQTVERLVACVSVGAETAAANGKEPVCYAR